MAHAPATVNWPPSSGRHDVRGALWWRCLAPAMGLGHAGVVQTRAGHMIAQSRMTALGIVVIDVLDNRLPRRSRV